MSLVVQPSLFGSSGKLGVAELGAAVERRPLSDGAWVDLRLGFVTAADELFDVLASTVPWHEERMHIYDNSVRAPRLLARYPQGEALPHSVLDEARSALNDHYSEELGGPFVSVGLCLYRDGSDSVAWHGDRIARESPRDTMVAIVSREHPWAKRKAVTLKALGREPLILREPGSAGRELVERALRTAGIEPHAVMEMTSTEAIKQAVEANGGVAVLARAVVQRDVAGGHLRALAVRGGDLTLRLAFAYHRERANSPLLRAVLDVIVPPRVR